MNTGNWQNIENYSLTTDTNKNAKKEVFIAGCGLVSAAGSSLGDHLSYLEDNKSTIKKLNETEFGSSVYGAPLQQKTLDALAELEECKSLVGADQSILASVLASEHAFPFDMHQPYSKDKLRDYMVFASSSRGAQKNFEQVFADYFKENKVARRASPNTTSGRFSASLANYLGCKGLNQFVSSTCTSGLMAMGTALAFIKSEFGSRAVVSAADCGLTPFMLKSMQHLKVYQKQNEDHTALPYQPFVKSNGMVLGEGAAAFTLSTDPDFAIAKIIGFGASSEATTLTGVSEQGEGLSNSIQTAIKQTDLNIKDVDLVITHGSGTKKGDEAEMNAYRSTFQNEMPVLTNYKWLTGHMLGAAPLASLALCLLSLKANKTQQSKIEFAPPYFQVDHDAHTKKQNQKPVKRILVCCLGFGGNSAAMLIELI